MGQGGAPVRRVRAAAGRASGAAAGVATALRGAVPVTTGRDAARQAAQRELSNPAYHQQRGNPLQDAVQWLWDRLGELLARAAGIAPGGWVGVTVCLVLIALLLGALLWRLGRPARQRRGAAAVLFEGRERTAAGHRAAAERHADEGDWSAAVRERVRAVVRSLEERALLDARPGRTADEAARAAGRVLPEYASDLRTAARRFDDVQYGGRSADEPDYRLIADLDRRLVRARPAGSAAGPGAAEPAFSLPGPGPGPEQPAQDGSGRGAPLAGDWQPPGGTL